MQQDLKLLDLLLQDHLQLIHQIHLLQKQQVVIGIRSQQLLQIYKLLQLLRKQHQPLPELIHFQQLDRQLVIELLM